jgi:hypothetical protein
LPFVCLVAGKDEASKKQMETFELEIAHVLEGARAIDCLPLRACAAEKTNGRTHIKMESVAHDIKNK